MSKDKKKVFLVYSTLPGEDSLAKRAAKLEAKLHDNEKVYCGMQELLEDKDFNNPNCQYIGLVAEYLEPVNVIVWDDAKSVYLDPLAQAVIAIADIAGKEISYRYCVKQE